MDVLLVIGRILFVAIFVASGLNHFRPASVQYAKAKGAPNAEMLVPLSGAAIILGGVLVALGLWADIGALILLAFALPVAYFMHAFWNETDPQMQQAEQAQFMKNVSMAGAALIVFWLYNQVQDVPASLTDALIGPI